jgi:MYXO-CTERM domain-containing protein
MNRRWHDLKMANRRVISVLVVCGCALALLPGSARAADLSADPSSYKALLPTLKAGDTLHLAAGHYPLLPLANLNGTPSAWITIAGPPGDPPTAIIDADPGPCCNTVEITNSSYLAIESLTIDGHDVDGAFGISAGGGSGNLVHDIRIEGCSLINHHGSQQDDAISTKTPTWGWIIRRNKILHAGTGLYLGNSDGSDPFVGGVIEDNLVENPIGYCMEIKFQNARPMIAGLPTAPTTTIIRNNVFIKNDDPSPDGDRPNLLVGGFPASGAGASDRYEIYGNFFDHNARESLLQASGRVTIHDNLFVDAPGQHAILLRDHDLPLELAYVYDNTIYSAGIGIDFGSAAPEGDAVVGNLVFANTAITGTISNQHDNLTDTVASAGNYVRAPSTTLGQLDLYPLAGKCQGAPIDASLFAGDTDHAIDFNGAPRGSFVFRGAYAGDGVNPGWLPGDGLKSSGSLDDGGAPDGGPAADAALPIDDAGPGAHSGGCSCSYEPAAGAGEGLALVVLLALAVLLARRRAGSQ